MSVSMAFSAVVGGEVLDSHLMMYVNCMCVCARSAVYKRTDISHSTP